MRTQRRRRKESKTDYRSRLGLLKSGLIRLVVRKTNRYIITQLVATDIAQDKVLITFNSAELLEIGWPSDKKGSLKSLPAAYLTGYILGKKSKSIAPKVIVDFGMYRNIHGSRLYAVIKGALDAGLNINIDEKALPKMERITSNKNISKSIIEKIKEKS